MNDALFFPYCERIDLHVVGRISKAQALRQEKTAAEILRRLANQPGLILADEVGMGKTFVALAVAISVAIQNRGKWPVVIMMPSALKAKWPTDFLTLKQKCLPEDLGKRVTTAQAENAVDFLKILSAPLGERKSVIFLTHGAMSRGLNDPFIKLALIKQSIHGKRRISYSPSVLATCLPRILDRHPIANRHPNLWIDLLNAKVIEWPELLKSMGIEEPVPVPHAITGVLDQIDTSEIFHHLKNLPQRVSKNYDAYLTEARRLINQSLRAVWKECLVRMQLKLPLLILDEAHHLKNQQTRLASLFHSDDSQKDAEEISQGPLAGVFQRMLFLTATPFQLGHGELCSVIDRFGGIQWKGSGSPAMTREAFDECRKDLRQVLDEAQASAIRFDDAWGRLTPAELWAGGSDFQDSEAWWNRAMAGDEITSTATEVLSRYRQAKERMQKAQQILSPWVIRHLKPRFFEASSGAKPTREKLAGRSIQTGIPDPEETGITVGEGALLPFLLAARATFLKPESRPIFAEGLASSYQAFLETRKPSGETVDGDSEPFDMPDVDREAKWYLDHLQGVVKRQTTTGSQHPKVSATVQRVLELWRLGEKVVVFCHFTRTGILLRHKISDAIGTEIQTLAREKLRVGKRQVAAKLHRIAERFFDTDSPLRKACDKECLALIRHYPELDSYSDSLLEIIRRNLRTPSFLVRYFPIGHKRPGASAMNRALETRDHSGLSLREVLHQFLRFLNDRCSEGDRDGYIQAMIQIQTGPHGAGTMRESFTPDELQGAKRERLLPNVRLVNGGTQQATRQRLMLAFNTPFYPEVLIASSVMAEGVDLHLNCRHVIHHDLSWNPSMLEQRTGRVDRLGSKGEHALKPIQIYLPYIAETQDEKMYRVVMDRERWFQVVMGEKYTIDAKTTEILASRIPLPASVAQQLAFDLSLPATSKTIEVQETIDTGTSRTAQS
jgi:ERCC4-related helicase